MPVKAHSPKAFKNVSFFWTAPLRSVMTDEAARNDEPTFY